MGLLTVFSAKGGCGASLVATNLAVLLARSTPTLLVDLHVHGGTDDLLLDLCCDHAWPELLPVAAEVKDRHIDLVARRHAGGLALLAAPGASSKDPSEDDRIRPLLDALVQRFAWVIVDAPSGTWSPTCAESSDMLLLVTTGDLPALRCARQLLECGLHVARGRLGLVLNQFGRGQPASASDVAASLDCPLLAVVPVDPRGVGYQINFGHPCVLDRQSPLGRSMAVLAGRIAAADARRPGTSLALHQGES